MDNCFITGGIDFKDKVINLGEMPVTNGKEIEAAVAAKQPLIMYGQLLYHRRHRLQR